jgi:hypothetical protein
MPSRLKLRGAALMGAADSSSTAVAIIAAMITPALLLLASASLVASVLMRMARVVDRARVLATIAHDGSAQKLGITPAQLRAWLHSHARRARHAERSITLLYTAIVVFVCTCLSIGLDRAAAGALGEVPVVLAMAGTLLLLGGGAYMVAESRLSSAQISAEITQALGRLES